MSRTDRELVRDALDHLAVLRRHAGRADLSDETVADAVSLRLAAAIESLSTTSVELRERCFAAEWKVMWATRNRIAHGYAYIDLPTITNTVIRDVPELERILTAELARR